MNAPAAAVSTCILAVESAPTVTRCSAHLPETIVRRRCAALIPYARNARTHSDHSCNFRPPSSRPKSSRPALCGVERLGYVIHETAASGHVVKLVKLPAFRPYTRARAYPRAYGANVSKFTNFTTRRRMDDPPA